MSNLSNNKNGGSAVRVAVIGCGAVTELYYTPALHALQKSGDVKVIALADPNAQRRATLHRHFPAATVHADASFLEQAQINLAIIASPVRFHSEHTRAAMKAGCAVLCEKPLAGSAQDAENMCQAAQQHGTLLAAGLFRRFFPALQTARDMIINSTLGAVKSFRFNEGGAFNWPAQSAALFQRESGCGGVLIDLGIHTLDILCWWFGEPNSIEYADDNMGGVEANCVVTLSFAAGFSGEVRLTRDWSVPLFYEVEFENGTLRWQIGQAERLQLEIRGSHSSRPHTLACGVENGLDYNRCFTAQIKNVADALRGRASLVVPAESALPAQRIIETCYRNRKLLHMPWLESEEQEAAARLALA